METLRQCLTRNVQRVLNELPKSLDETYKRVLEEINEVNREDAYRLLQCLTVAMRPLRVEELAEVLAVEFDSAEGIPKLNPDWRWEDQEEALQAACSSLIAIVDTDGSKFVQFSHFSVKEYLTSPRLASSTGDVSGFRISLEPAHTILARACLGVLLRLDNEVEKYSVGNKFPLAQYAAEHWVDHAQFGSVSSRVRKEMEHLFDPSRPHFAACLELHDRDTRPADYSAFFMFRPFSKSDTTPLYYAALCGFYDVTEHLIAEHRQDVDARGGYLLTPLVASLAGNHFQIAQLLHDHGADVDVRGDVRSTPLTSASYEEYPKIVEWLLNHGADANARDRFGWTPILLAASRGHPETARMLLEHNVDIAARFDNGQTSLHVAAQHGHLDVVRLLLGHGVDVNARNNNHSTPLHLATEEGKLEVVHLLLEHDTDVEAEDNEGKTAFQLASAKGHDEVARLLSDMGPNEGTL
jgi:ankyrin repeat protein